MSRQNLISLIVFKYGLNQKQATNFVNSCFDQGLTWLDILRKVDFQTKLNRYGQQMQFA